MQNSKPSSQPTSSTKQEGSILDSLLNDISYQLSRYSDITYSYEKILDKLEPGMKDLEDNKTSSPVPNGHLNVINILIHKLSLLNDYNQQLLIGFNKIV